MEPPKEFVAKMEELLEQPSGSMTGDEKLEDMDGWDSMTLISFMAMADEHCGRKPTPRKSAAARQSMICTVS